MAEHGTPDLRLLDARMAAALPAVDLERTRRMLAGEREARMSEVPTSIRLSEDLVARLDKLAERMSRDPKTAALAGTGISRTAALRLAILEGVEVLEARYGRKR
jgi:predicted transcriptional regulator